MKHLIYAAVAASVLGLAVGGAANACEHGNSAALKNPAANMHAAAGQQGYVVAQSDSSDQGSSSDDQKKKDDDSK